MKQFYGLLTIDITLLSFREDLRWGMLNLGMYKDVILLFISRRIGEGAELRSEKRLGFMRCLCLKIGLFIAVLGMFWPTFSVRAALK